ncbi:MAG: hypothetical protein HKN13_12880 [Rhodothermales bacterium]|nr:hypothetical protein [Rhodothermales bacterium]
MNPDDIDDILSNEKLITPSPDFLASVMRAVRRQAATLPPLKFPWRRALPGIVATFVAIIRAVWDMVGFVNEPDVVASFKEQLHQFAEVASQFGVQWIVLAVAITVVSLMLSISLVSSEHYATNDGRIRRMLRAAASIVRKSG